MMRLKHFAAGFIFLAAFSVSVLITGVPKCETKSYKITPVQKQTVRRADTELQNRLRTFLEADRQTGREFSKDLGSFQAQTNYFNAEAIATGVLVRKMNDVACVNLPDDFCAAWEAHYQSWNKKNKFFDIYKVEERLKTDEDLRKENLNLTVEINRTYDKMIQVAEKYDVYFSY